MGFIHDDWKVRLHESWIEIKKQYDAVLPKFIENNVHFIFFNKQYSKDE